MVGDLYGRKIPLSKTTKFIVDNRGRTAPTAAYGIPLIATNCISNDQLYPAYEKLRFVSQETYTSWFRSHPQPGDIILTNKGSQNGAICLVPDPVDFVIAQDMVALRADEEVIDPLFLFAALRSPGVQREIKNLDVSGVIPHFKKSDFDNLHLPYPDRVVQEAIGRIYFDFCHKIELNRRMNATLEEMARALFHSWFVDFDPVRAKLDGRPPAGLDPATAALFPDSFEDSPMGPIPTGWDIKMVCEIGDVICGKTPSTAVGEYYGKDMPFITIPDMHGNVFAVFTTRRLSQAGVRSQANKTLPPGSLCVSCIATPGLVVITSEESQTNQQINSLVPYADDETYFWYWIMRGLGTEIESNGSGGSVLTNLSKGRFATLKVIKPPLELIASYHSTIKPLFQKILANIHQSRTLATQRDTLLPKLLSGELSVAEMTSKHA
jgi:type I restriction enzyme S subunit